MERDKALIKELRMISHGLRKGRRDFKGQKKVLYHLNQNDGITQGLLVELMDIRPSSLTELLKRMEEKGDITRKDDANDKRIKIVYLTPQGQEEAQNLSFDDSDNKLFEDFTEAEKDELLSYLKKIKVDRNRRHRIRNRAIKAYEKEHGPIDWDNFDKKELKKYMHSHYKRR